MASSSSSSWKYDVFLSFRGEDTRKTFVDHLYYALETRTIRTYKDDVTLDRGDTIGPSLLNAIQSSQISVIIFSENYADSSWCLDELTHIMKCRDSETGQIVFPIFYHVDPSDVRKQKGTYGEAFAKHELSENNKKKVESWKKALVDASNIAGWEPKHVANGHEAKCIQEIVDSILGELSSLNPVVDDENLVGIGDRLKDLKSWLRIGSGGVRMVGIWGLGGGGKTTLATSLFMEISGVFDGCCFVDNIREESKQNGLKSLQEKVLSAVFGEKMKIQSVDIGKHTIKRMLCRRNVLIVLDDVDHLEQLTALAGSLAWFGDGSRIIITTRDEHVLTAHRVDVVFPINLLSHDEAIRLFNKHAYHEHKPIQDYKMLSEQIVSYAAGLPLALIVLGSFLYDKNQHEWLSTLARLKDHPEMDIVEKLKISYDGLKAVEKELFLDIACFHRGKKSKESMEMLDASGFYAHVGVKVLIQKALITLRGKNDKFDMHDLVQEMGHFIVRHEHPNNPEKHTRVWLKKDIEDICLRNATMENDKIEAIQCDVIGCSPGFNMLVSNIKKLRFLKVSTSFDEGPNFLSNELRYIDWGRYPASLFPESFQPTKLVILRLVGSLQKELWKGCKYLPSLKELELFGASKLVRTPDFGGLPSLQTLILDICDSLEEIDVSLGNHASLVYLSVMRCNKLTRFPAIVKMDNLEVLKILSCKALVEFPKIEAKMNNLVMLSLFDLEINVLPVSVGEYCTKLQLLLLKNCSNLKSIEGNFHALKGLLKIELKGCELEKLPKDLFNENLDCLILDLDGSSMNGRLILSQLPRFLRKLNLNKCGLKDGVIPSEIGELSNLQLINLSNNNFTRLDFSLSKLTRLKFLYLDDCKYLVELPELPSSLATLLADNCESLEVIIRDDTYKWLCKVSFALGTTNIIGSDRLLESMIQGNIERGMMLRLASMEIAKLFIPRPRGDKCRLQLPDNWYNDFSGFLICARPGSKNVPLITMKHVGELEGCSMGMEDSLDGAYWGNTGSWSIYISFSLLRNTSWWNPTSNAIEIGIDTSFMTFRGCACKLIPKRSETSITDSSSSIDDVSDDFALKLEIEEDSKSVLRFFIDN